MFIAVQTIKKTQEAGPASCICCNWGNLLLMNFLWKQIPNVFAERLVEKLTYVNFSIFFFKGVTFTEPLATFLIDYLASVMTAPQSV